MFSKQITHALKGIFAVVILIHHLLTRSGLVIENDAISLIITHLGYWGVSVFLFISGYGLMFSYSSGGGYKESFIMKRLLPMVALNFYLIVIYTLQKLLLHQNISVDLILQSFLVGKTVVKFGWYFQTIIIFYLLFYLSMCIKFKNKLLLNVALVILYIFTCVMANVKSYYYITAISFPLGMLYAQYYDKINHVIDNWKYQSSLVLIVALFIIIWLQLAGFQNILVIPLESCIFVTLVVATSTSIPLVNKLTKVLGDYSLAIYAFQGLAYGFVSAISLPIVSKPLLFMISWTVLTYVIAYIMNPLIYRIMNKIRKVC